jgi:uncharacterized protein YecE (DUF72 family)
MIQVGCCGFSASMRKYFEKFSTSELNSTFYRYPQDKTVEGWRQKAPKSFEFTVKAHQDISHRSLESYKNVEHLLEEIKSSKKITD